jgi:hypothetical protein
MASLAIAGSSTFEVGIMKSASGTAIVVAVMITTIPLNHPSALAQGDPSDASRKAAQGRPARRARAPRRLAPADIPRRIFEEFRKEAPGLSASSVASRNSATVMAYPSYWECGDGQTLLTVDVRGNASYRKTAGWSPNPPGNNADPNRPAYSGLDEAKLIEKTRQLAKPWISADSERSLTPAVKRETVLLALVPDGQITEMAGRTIVRLRGGNELDTGYFQAVFDPTGAPLRVDLALANARTADYCNLALLARIPAHGQAKNDKPLALGCFFDPDEYRFEITALSVEGERFLDLYQAANPFGRDDYDLHRPHRVSARHYSQSEDYHWWCWTWWQRYGRVGGFRGNWLKKGSKAVWQYTHNHLLHHRSLASYGLVGGSPRQTKVIERPNGPPVEFPHAVNQHFEPAFYRDLEQCHVAFMFSHGGRLGDFYQMRRGLDVWVVLMPGSGKLGTGNLRHLFLSGCAAFNYRNDRATEHLERTWIRRAPADGLRTVCGADGGAGMLDRGGWRYFGYYNKGESISDSWALSLLDEGFENWPATAAYGATPAEAIESLLSGRFSDQKIDAKAVAISLWAGSTPR